MENERLCEACQAIFVITESQIYTHTLGGFQESATNGCHFCAMRWAGLSPDQRSELLTYEHRIDVECYSKRWTGNVPRLKFSYRLDLWHEVARLDFALLQCEGRLAMLENPGSERL